MNDVDRWINLEGPAPPGIREMLEAARAVPPLTPELEEELDRRFYAALAAQRAARAQERRRKVWRVAGLLVAGLLVALMLALAVGVERP